MNLKMAKYIAAIPAAIATILVYLPALQNGFVSWDDNVYVYENLHIRSLDLNFLKWAFFSFHASNWHPLTWVSHAIDYALWGLNPLGHHLTSVILHGLNTFLVVILIANLLKAVTIPRSSSLREEGGEGGVSVSGGFLSDRGILTTAVITGLLFGLHPLHVESVAWVSERKDVLCAFFFLLSLMSYISYAANTSQNAEGIEHGAKIYFAFTQRSMLYALCFFILALLSKPMAVTLPVVLIILDWYPFRRFDGIGRLRPVVIEKLPFFTLSLASATLTLLAQYSGRMIRPMDVYPLSGRILVGFKALTSYLGKMVWPVRLSPYYSYPRNTTFLSSEYLLPIVLVVGITVACMVLSSRQRLWSALWGYYVITLLPVLGIIQVGGQAMADRYAYLPSISPFLLISLGVTLALEKLIASSRWNMIIKTVSLSTVIALTVSISYITIKQIRIWKDSVTLWSRVIEIEPMKDDMPYHNRGVGYINLGNFEDALEDLTRAIYLDPYAVGSYYVRGIAFMNLGHLEEALKDFSKVIGVGPVPENNYCINAYLNRAIVYTKLGRFEEAKKDFMEAERIKNKR